MKAVSSTEAKAKLNALLAEIESTGAPATITSHGVSVAILSPATPKPRTFGQLARKIAIPDDFDTPMSGSELALWEGRG